MKGKKSIPAFAEIKTGNVPETIRSSCSLGWKYVRLLYPDGVTLLLPYGIDSKDLSRFINL